MFAAILLLSVVPAWIPSAWSATIGSATLAPPAQSAPLNTSKSEQAAEWLLSRVEAVSDARARGAAAEVESLLPNVHDLGLKNAAGPLASLSPIESEQVRALLQAQAPARLKNHPLSTSDAQKVVKEGVIDWTQADSVWVGDSNLVIPIDPANVGQAATIVGSIPAGKEVYFVVEPDAANVFAGIQALRPDAVHIVTTDRHLFTTIDSEHRRVYFDGVADGVQKIAQLVGVPLDRLNLTVEFSVYDQLEKSNDPRVNESLAQLHFELYDQLLRAVPVTQIQMDQITEWGRLLAAQA
jgi:hypothetical protein